MYPLVRWDESMVADLTRSQARCVGLEGTDLHELAEAVLYDVRERRGINLRGILQHRAAVSLTRSRYKNLPNLTVPTLVMHGSTDQFLPIAHAEKLVELIPDAKHLWLEGVGHVFPYPAMETVNDRILAHLSAAYA